MLQPQITEMLNGRPQFRQKNRNRSYSESQSGIRASTSISEDDKSRKSSGTNLNKTRLVDLVYFYL